MSDIYNTKPDFVNKQNVKYWLCKNATIYALNKELKNVNVFYVEFENGERTILISQDGQPIYDSPDLEKIGIHIDLMSLNR